MFKDYILARTACDFTTQVTLARGKSAAINPMGNKGNPRYYLLQGFCENSAGNRDECRSLQAQLYLPWKTHEDFSVHKSGAGGRQDVCSTRPKDFLAPHLLGPPKAKSCALLSFHRWIALGTNV